MRLLQRYILFELLRIFAFVLSIITVLLVFVGIFNQVTMNGLGPQQVLQILPFIVPSLLPFTIPATLLLTVTVVYGRMAGDQEITAAKSAGISAVSLLWPSFLMAGVLCICSLVLEDQTIPWAMKNIERAVALATKTSPSTSFATSTSSKTTEASSSPLRMSWTTADRTDHSTHSQGARNHHHSGRGRLDQVRS
jgi:lipopolysaccharide export system permease protein